jgi:ribosome-binding ATPase
MLIGIVGKPNVGKSTFFKSMTLMNVLIENYPFATITPNRGAGHVRVKCVEDEFNIKCSPAKGYCKNKTRFIPVELIDVAGLVPGAHEGKGMGNQFLDDLRQADAFIHVIDVSGSTNERGENVSLGSYNPSDDIKFLEDELNHWIHGILKNNWTKLIRKAKQCKIELYKEIHKQFSGFNLSEKSAKKILNEMNSKNTNEWDEKDLFLFSSKIRNACFPMIIAANKIDKSNGLENLEKLKKEFPDYKIIGCSAEIELALREANNKDIIDYTPGSNNFKIVKQDLPDKLKTALGFMNNFLKKFSSTGVNEILDYTVFNILDYIGIFPGGTKGLEDKHGRKLPDCFLLKNGSTALDFAYFLHTDIGNTFIKAIDVRTKRALGKEYKLKHRDVIEILTS